MWWWIGGGYIVGGIATMVINVGLLIGSGGMVTNPRAIVRNGIFWPIMLPIVYGMYLQSQR